MRKEESVTLSMSKGRKTVSYFHSLLFASDVGEKWFCFLEFFLDFYYCVGIPHK